MHTYDVTLVERIPGGGTRVIAQRELTSAQLPSGHYVVDSHGALTGVFATDAEARDFAHQYHIAVGAQIAHVHNDAPDAPVMFQCPECGQWVIGKAGLTGPCSGCWARITAPVNAHA